MDQFSTYVGIIASLVGIVGVVFALPEKEITKKGRIIILSVLGIVMASGPFFLFITTVTPHTPSNPFTPANVAAAIPMASPTPSPTPTATAMIIPTATSAPILEIAKTLPENIRLACTCSDRVVVTITQIVIQPDQNRMIWSITFSNTSQKSASAVFADSNFSLQKGDQINNPAPGELKYGATGSVIGTFSGINLQAGETQQVTITFSFVPYTGIAYTLVSIMQMDCCGGEIAHFNPVVLQL